MILTSRIANIGCAIPLSTHDKQPMTMINHSELFIDSNRNKIHRLFD